MGYIAEHGLRALTITKLARSLGVTKGSFYWHFDSLEALLDACDWNMSMVARRLGVNRSTVLRRMRKAGLSARR